jgi:hypothetical protein
MMTKLISRIKVLISKTALLSFFSGLTFFMCIKSAAQEKPITSPENIAKTEKRTAQPVEKDEVNIQENAVYSIHKVTEKPTFPGGMDQFYMFVGKNFKSPKEDVKGKFYVTFIIEKDGSLSNITSKKDLGFGTGDEAIRVLKLCPKWISGKIDGNPVRVSYNFPITLSMAN